MGTLELYLDIIYLLGKNEVLLKMELITELFIKQSHK